MKFWRSKLARLWLPEEAIREAYEQNEAGHRNPLWPMCQVCSRTHGTPTDVVEYGIRDHGKVPGGDYWTAFYAKCHGEEDVMRIDGFRYETWAEGAPDNAARLAAIASLPFFAKGAERELPLQALRHFMAGSVDERIEADA